MFVLTPFQLWKKEREAGEWREVDLEWGEGRRLLCLALVVPLLIPILIITLCCCSMVSIDNVGWLGNSLLLVVIINYVRKDMLGFYS